MVPPLVAHGLEARFVEANAQSLDALFATETFDWIIFWASLEHMTVPERLDALAAAWSRLSPGGLLSLVETPNRLWFQDSHTSRLPFFMWLPDELAFRVAHLSPRAGFGDRYDDVDTQLLDFLRRGRGVSYHELEVALGPEWRRVHSCMQISRRDRQILRRASRFSPAVPLPESAEAIVTRSRAECS